MTRNALTEGGRAVRAVGRVIAAGGSGLLVGYVLGRVVAVDPEAAVWTAFLMPFAFAVAWGVTRPFLLMFGIASAASRLFSAKGDAGTDDARAFRYASVVFLVAYTAAVGAVGVVGGFYRGGFGILASGALFALAGFLHAVLFRRTLAYLE